MRLDNGEVLLCWPLTQHIITAGWTYNDGSAHNAIDLRAAVGTPVYAAEDGTVDQRQVWDGYTTTGMQSYGNMLRIRHADYNGHTLQTRYAHLSKICVGMGEHVEEGQLIGYSGATGNVQGAHLHFEVLCGGVRYNPLNWLDAAFSCASAAVEAHLGSYISVTRPASGPNKAAGKGLSAGGKLELKRIKLYISSTAMTAAGTRTGTYYLWSTEAVNGRVRITNAPENVGRAGKVTGWISEADAKAAAGKEAAASGTEQMIELKGVPNVHAMAVFALCQQLKLIDMGLYHAEYTNAEKTMQNIKIGPVSNGDAATIYALVKDHGQAEKYSAEYV